MASFRKSLGAFREIAADLRHKILAGAHDRARAQYPPGSRLPAEKSLAAEYDVGTGTVTRALAVLQAEGLVTKTARGSTVSQILIKLTRSVPERYSRDFRERNGAKGAFDAEVQAAGLIPKWVSTERTDGAPEHIAQILGVPAGTPVAITERIMSVAHPDAPGEFVPVQLATSYVPKTMADAAGVGGVDRGVGGLISRLADAGYAQEAYEETTEVRPPSEQEAQQLGLIPDHRVFELTHAAYTGPREGGAVCTEVTEHVMPCHLWKLRMCWTAEQ